MIYIYVNKVYESANKKWIKLLEIKNLIKELYVL